ncbi:hypothetical protein CUJ88_46055 (plasmid) [Paraburkholderia hospita]|nr:hypothetical protein CUJ88_46055 [Paraburkholderia hospita]
MTASASPAAANRWLSSRVISCLFAFLVKPAKPTSLRSDIAIGITFPLVKMPSSGTTRALDSASSEAM